MDVVVKSPSSLREIRAIDVRYGTKQISEKSWFLVCFVRGREGDGFLLEYEFDAADVVEISIAKSMAVRTDSNDEIVGR